MLRLFAPASLVLMACLLDAGDSHSDVFEKLRESPSSEQQLDDLIASTRAALQRDPRRIADVLALLEDDHVVDRVRSDLIEVLLERPEETALRGLLRHAARSIAHPDLDTPTRLRMVRLLEGLAAHPALETVRDNPELIAVLFWAAKNEYAPPENCAGRWNLIWAAPVEDSIKSRLVFDATLSSSACGVRCSFPLHLLDEADRERLREMFRRWNGDASTFPQRAVYALTLLGDPAILDAMRNWRSNNPAASPSILSSVEVLIDMTEARQSPQALLHYVGNRASGPEDVVCLLDQTAQWKSDPVEVRAALEQYKRRMSEAAQDRAKSPKSACRLRLLALQPVREEAIRLGYLGEGDWPDIRPRGESPAPMP